MKIFIGRLLLTILIIGSLFGLKSLWQRIVYANAECVPFVVRDVPNEKEPQWKLYNSHQYFLKDGNDKETAFWVGVKYYKTESGISLGVYEYYGEIVVMKAWACRVGQDPKTKDAPDHMVAIQKDGKWYTANVQYPKQKKLIDSKGNLHGFVITLIDKDGKEIVSRIITYP